MARLLILGLLIATHPATAQDAVPRKPLDVEWQRSVFHAEETPGETEAKNLAQKHVREQTKFLFGAAPVFQGNAVCIRTFADVQVRNIRSLPEQKTKPGDLRWIVNYFDGPLAVLLDDPKTKSIVASIAATHFARIALENQLLGSISSDKDHSYIVDDAGIAASLLAQVGPFGQPLPKPARVKELVEENALLGFIVDGRVVWSLGGESIRSEKNIESKKATDFTGTHFLGTPLIRDKHLWVLNERAGGGQCRLVQINPNKIVDGKPEVVSTTGLDEFDPRRRFGFDLRRRMFNAQPIAAGDLILCPTAACVLAAWNAKQQQWAWKYKYLSEGEEKPVPQPFPGAVPLPHFHWKPSAPFVHGEHVIFASTEEEHLHCVKLKDGTSAWKVKQQPNDWYPAGAVGKHVLVIHETGCRFVKAEDGSDVKNLELGAVSGRGVLVAGDFYLPLAEISGKGPGIAVVDVANLRVRSYLETKDVPRNLAWHDGQLFSQGLTEIAAFKK